MLLAVDIGNTQTVSGLFNLNKGSDFPNELPLNSFRVSTDKQATAEQLAVVLSGLLKLSSYNDPIKTIIISSVVPRLTGSYQKLADDFFNSELVIVNHSLKTGIDIAYPNPCELGSDRIANGVAAKIIYGYPAIVVDFGTATTFDVINDKGQYLGGVIAPGVETSINALISNASKLSQFELSKPEKVIGVTTTKSLNSGVIHGFSGQVDRINKMISQEINQKTIVIATGGLAELMAPCCATIDKVDEFLTLKGLNIIYKGLPDKQAGIRDKG
ncbi:MAG: type III pantothenate kinase [Actinobacteria bacterium]|nr:MAG: type III pantothenate kinase [Actinomycetota bacterium]